MKIEINKKYELGNGDIVTIEANPDRTNPFWPYVAKHELASGDSGLIYFKPDFSECCDGRAFGQLPQLLPLKEVKVKAGDTVKVTKEGLGFGYEVGTLHVVEKIDEERWFNGTDGYYVNGGHGIILSNEVVFESRPAPTKTVSTVTILSEKGEKIVTFTVDGDVVIDLVKGTIKL